MPWRVTRVIFLDLSAREFIILTLFPRSTCRKSVILTGKKNGFVHNIICLFSGRGYVSFNEVQDRFKGKLIF